MKERRKRGGREGYQEFFLIVYEDGKEANISSPTPGIEVCEAI